MRRQKTGLRRFAPSDVGKAERCLLESLSSESGASSSVFCLLKSLPLDTVL
ncbi:MAG: hypothetical protein LBD06_08455 [Candidatus Accumulibacter sp.]|nr:hypothetical protein [Accumulibacter sp.]